MGYIDPKTDIVVAAGGDGTLFEVCKHKCFGHKYVCVCLIDDQWTHEKIRCGWQNLWCSIFALKVN